MKRKSKESGRRQEALGSFTVDLLNFHCAFLGLCYFTFLEFFSKLLNAYENPSILFRPISNIPLAPPQSSLHTTAAEIFQMR